MIPEAEPLDEPLPVRPDVVVFGILLEHARNKLGLAAGVVEPVDDQLPVMPDLVVLFMPKGCVVDVFDLAAQIKVESKDYFCAVKPAGRSI